MVRITSSLAALALAVAPVVLAQTFSECDPTKKAGCAPNSGLNQAQYTIDFTKEATKAAQDFKTTSGNVTYTSDGATFSIKDVSDGPTIQSNFYIFFGRVEVKMKSAPGAGIVSSFVMESDDLDELDWEMIGSQTTQVQSNYFGKGNTTTYDRGQYHPVATPADTFHTYAVDWNKDSTKWYVDGQLVRTLNFADAVGGSNYPQTPMNIRLGNWVGGRPGNAQGTIEWAGGLADMSKGPFTMTVQTVTITNYNPAASYSYGDQSGNWQSIKLGSEPVNNNAAGTSSSSAPAAHSSAPAGAGEGSTGPGTVSVSVASGVAASSSPCSKGGKPEPTGMSSGGPGKHGDGNNSGNGGQGGYGHGGEGSSNGQGNSGHGGEGNSGSEGKPSHGGKGSPGESSAYGSKPCSKPGPKPTSVGVGGNAAPPASGTVTVNPAATGIASNNGTAQSFGAGPIGSAAPASSAASGGIVQDGAPGDGTQPTFTVNVGSSSSLVATVSSASVNPGASTFALGGNTTATAGPAQQTTNGGVQRGVGSTGALAVGLGLVVLFV